MCKYHGLEKIMGIRCDWNEEVILQFYSTFFFHKNNSCITWMTDETKYSICIGLFASILGIGASAKNPLNLHDENVLGLSQMASMYETSDFNAPTITNFKMEMIVLHQVIRKTLAPREGDSYRVPQFERNLLKAISEKTKFNAFDFIIQEMWNIAISNNCSYAYAPRELLSRMWSTFRFALRSGTTPCLPQLLQFLVLLPPPPQMSPAPPPHAARLSSSSSRVYSPFVKATSKLWMWFISTKKCFLKISVKPPPEDAS
jgi:hypothetical protein